MAILVEVIGLFIVTRCVEAIRLLLGLLLQLLRGLFNLATAVLAWTMHVLQWLIWPILLLGRHHTLFATLVASWFACHLITIRDIIQHEVFDSLQPKNRLTRADINRRVRSAFTELEAHVLLTAPSEKLQRKWHRFFAVEQQRLALASCVASYPDLIAAKVHCLKRVRAFAGLMMTKVLEEFAEDYAGMHILSLQISVLMADYLRRQIRYPLAASLRFWL